MAKKFTYNEFEQWCKQIEASTPIDIEEAIETKMARKKRALEDYQFFFEYYFPRYCEEDITEEGPEKTQIVNVGWGHKFKNTYRDTIKIGTRIIKCAWYHLLGSNILAQNRVISFVEEIYRGGAKSVHSSMARPLWFMVKGEMHGLLLISKTEKMANRLLAAIQANLMRNTRFINDFGDQFNHGSWEEGEFVTKNGVAFYALGLGQSPRGTRNEEHRPDMIVFDDCDSKKLSKNPALVREAVDWAMEDLYPTMDKGYKRFIIANNRFAKISILGSIVDEKLKDAKQIALKKIPAPGAASYQVKGNWHHLKVDAVDEFGNPSWPEKYSRAYWQELREDSTQRAWMREYMNSPIVEGTVFKNNWIHYKPAMDYSRYEELICYFDPSYKATASSDYKAIVLIGKAGREYHILNAFVRKCSISVAVKHMYDLHETIQRGKGGEAVCSYWMEVVMIQDLFLQEFAEEGDLRGYQLRIRRDERAKPDKFSRIENLSPLFERGHIFFNSDENGEDMQRGVDQFLGFEKGSKINDDFPDACEGGIFLLNKRGRVRDFEPIVERLERRNQY
jgi:hypothetical protein